MSIKTSSQEQKSKAQRHGQACDARAAEAPGYAAELAAFHRTFRAELAAVITSLPIAPAMRVLDVGCGDGFYMTLFAERLAPASELCGLDSSAYFLKVARETMANTPHRCKVRFIDADISDGEPAGANFDLIWCAQSLYSLPEPADALRKMAAMLRPGGMVAVLENDSLHELLLPWPAELELELRAAEMAALQAESHHPHKFYIGRRLPQVMAEAGLKPLGFQTRAVDRMAPFDDDLQLFLAAHLEKLMQRIDAFITPVLRHKLAKYTLPGGQFYLPKAANATLTWVNTLAWAIRE